MTTTTPAVFRYQKVDVADTFAEAFPMTATRLVITADTLAWARIAATEATGHATSVIACDVEAAIERELPAEQTPDGRPGVAVLMFGFSRSQLEEGVVSRVGQCVLTCPTTACYGGLQRDESSKIISLGKQLRFFGDGFQVSKRLGTTRYWRIPVMDGEFVCEDRIVATEGIGGGNLILCGSSPTATLAAAQAAAEAMRHVVGVVLPFPGGLVRSGSKVGSRYARLKASTNDAYCPTLQGLTDSQLPPGTGCVYEIVIDGLNFTTVQSAMRAGLNAAAEFEDLTLITAGNYGGKLGKHHFHLKELVE